MEDKPLEGIRRKKDSSMVRAIDLVREGRADAVISAGNTGALVAGSMKLRRLDGIDCDPHLPLECRREATISYSSTRARTLSASGCIWRSSP